MAMIRLTQDCLDLSFQTGYKLTPFFIAHTGVVIILPKLPVLRQDIFGAFGCLTHCRKPFCCYVHMLRPAAHAASNHCHATMPCPWPCCNLDDSAVDIAQVSHDYCSLLTLPSLFAFAIYSVLFILV